MYELVAFLVWLLLSIALVGGIIALTAFIVAAIMDLVAAMFGN